MNNRLAEQLNKLSIAKTNEVVSSEHFWSILDQLEQFLPTGKSPLLENF